MSATPPDSEVVPDDDAIEGLEIPESGRAAWYALAAVIALVAVVAILPWAFGFGPFAIRLLTSAEIEVHVLNLSGDDVHIELPVAADRPVPAGTMEALATLEGRFTIAPRRDDGTVVEEVEVDARTPVFYNVGGGRCFAVFDITNFYGGEGEVMTVVARLDEDARIHVFDADTVLLPRRTPPTQARGRVHWLEPVGCSLLDPEEEDYLIGSNLVRLEHRRDQYEEALREAR